MQHRKSRRLPIWMMLVIILLTPFFEFGHQHVAQAESLGEKWKPSFTFNSDTQKDNVVAPNQSQPKSSLLFGQTVSDWLMDESRGYIYAISSDTNKLYFIRKNDLTIEKELVVGSKPTDIVQYGDKLYIALNGATMIQTVDLNTKELSQQIITTGKPYQIAATSTHLIYTSYPTYDIYTYDFSTQTSTKIPNTYGSTYIVADEKTNTLYVGGTELLAYNYKTGQKITNNDYYSEFDFGNGKPYIFLDETSVYYSGYQIKKDNLKVFEGYYPSFNEENNVVFYDSDIIDVSSHYVLSRINVFDKKTHQVLGKLPFKASDGLIDNAGVVYLFNSTTKTIESYSLDLSIPAKVSTVKNRDRLGSFNYVITDWVTNDVSPYIFAIFNATNELVIIDKNDFHIVRKIDVGSYPKDIEMYKTKLYIALGGETNIAVYDTANLEKANYIVHKIKTQSIPENVIPSEKTIFYNGSERVRTFYATSDVNGASNVDNSSKIGNMVVLDGAINTANNSLIISNSYSYFYSINLNTLTLSNSVSGSSNHLVLDQTYLYSGRERRDPSNLTTIQGKYPEDVLYAKDKWVFSSNAVYDRDTFLKVSDFPFNAKKIFMTPDNNVYFSTDKGSTLYKVNINAISEGVQELYSPISFALLDTDLKPGSVKGYIQVQPADSNLKIEDYVFYYLDANKNKLTNIFTWFKQKFDDGTILYEIPWEQTIPKDAVYLAAYPEISGYQLIEKPNIDRIWDAPTYLPTNFSLTDSKPSSNMINGKVTWSKGVNEPTDGTYLLCWLNSEGPFGEPIAAVQAGKSTYSVPLTNVKIPENAVGVGLILVIHDEYFAPIYRYKIFEQYLTPKLTSQSISIIKNKYSNDRVTVTGLQPNDIIRVYDESETYLYSEATVQANQTSVTMSIYDIGNPNEKISITRETSNKFESEGLLVTVPTYSDSLPPTPTPTPIPTPSPTPTVHTITVTAGTHGTISPSGSVAVVEGKDQTFTITPERGYEIDTLQIDGVDATVTKNTYTFVNVKSNHTISVTFKAVKDVAAPLAPVVNEVEDTATTITGTTQAGAKVTAKVGTKIIGEATASTTGQFTITISKQVAGITIVITATDTANNVSVPTTVTVKDVTPPSAPVVNVVKDNAKKVTGKAEAGSIVSVMVGSKVIGTTKAGNNGDFTVFIPSQKAGTVLKVLATDLAENTSKQPTSVTVIDKTPPAKPIVDTVNSTSFKVTGKAEVGSTVIVKVGSKLIGTATAGKDGKFSVKIPKQKAGIVMTIIAKDKNGNESVVVKATVKK